MLVLMLALGPGSIDAIQSTAAIEGVAVEAGSAQPIAGLIVSLMPEDRGQFPSLTALQGKSAITDSMGRFTLQGVEPGRYLVVPNKDGLMFSQPESVRTSREPGVWVQVHPGERVLNVQLRMVRESVIAGTVLDANGKAALDNINVSLRISTYGEDGSRGLANARGIKRSLALGRPNDRGEFRFYGVPAGDYYVSVSGIGGLVYYPGTTDESKAESVHVDAGQELHLTPITFLPKNEKRILVRLKYSGVTLQSPPTVYFGNGALFSTNPIGEPVGGTQEQTISMLPGHHDLLISGAGAYGRTTLDVGIQETAQEVTLYPGVQARVRVVKEDASGRRTAFAATPSSFGCGIRLEMSPASFLCNASADGRMSIGGGLSFSPSRPTPAIPPGEYRLLISRLPVDLYIAAASIDGRNVLKEVFKIDRETEIEIVLAPGSVIEGNVRSSSTEKLPAAIVALVPDDAPAGAWHLYRSVVADMNGQFEMAGVAPGSYHLYAWPDLEGAAYRNAEFMKDYVGKGKAVHVEKGDRVAVDITAF